MNHVVVLSFIVAMYYGNVSTGHGAKGRIGIKYDPVHHRIVTIYKNSPASEANLRVGDIVKYVNDKDITGPAFTFVNLTIRRGSRTFTIVIERVPNEYIDERQIDEDSEERQDIDISIPPKNC